MLDSGKIHPKISVIVPIYGVEKFIGHCAENLLNQTLHDVEFIFVNDATCDNSIIVLQSVIDKYPERKKQVKIVTHETNQGLPAARNTGLSAANGKYIYHCDSDDYLDIEALEQMYLCAENNDADIIWCDFMLSFEDYERYIKQPEYEKPQEALVGMLRGRLLYNVWNKLIRRSLYLENNISFPQGHTMGEDMTIMKLISLAQKVHHLPKAFYHYVQWNQSSLMGEAKYKHFEELYFNVENVTNFLAERNGLIAEKELEFFKLLIKWPLLIDGRKTSFDLWNKWFPEANKYIWESFHICLRIRFLEWCAVKKQFWIIYVHYLLILRGYNRIRNIIRRLKQQYYGKSKDISNYTSL